MSRKKKEKVVYYDDGSSLADMSSVGGIGRRAPKDKPAQSEKRKSTFSEKWKTYWNAVKLMFVPMLIALFIIALLFLLLMLL